MYRFWRWLVWAVTAQNTCAICGSRFSTDAFYYEDVCSNACGNIGVGQYDFNREDFDD